MTESSEIKVGDMVTVRAKVVDVGPADVGLAVELFSRTDQYRAWIRADLVAEHTPKPTLPPEPEPGAYHFTHPGATDPWTVLRCYESWTAGCTDWMEWPEFWALYGGPDVTITKLVPALPEMEPERMKPWCWWSPDNGNELHINSQGAGGIAFVVVPPRGADDEYRQYGVVLPSHHARSVVLQVLSDLDACAAARAVVRSQP